MACVRPRSSAPRPACAKPRSTARGNPPTAQPRSGKPAGPSWHQDCDSACQGRKSQADPFLSLATKPACRSLIQCAQSKRAIFRGAHKPCSQLRLWLFVRTPLLPTYRASGTQSSTLRHVTSTEWPWLGVRAVELIMTAPLSQDLRERIVRVVEGGSTTGQGARRFAVSASAAIKLMQRVRQTGSAAPAKIGGYRRPLLEKHADDLRAIVSSKAGITLREIKAALTARGIMVKALSTIADMLHRLDLSHKKRA